MFSGGIVDFWRVPNKFILEFRISNISEDDTQKIRRLFELYARSLRKIRLHMSRFAGWLRSHTLQQGPPQPCHHDNIVRGTWAVSVDRLKKNTQNISCFGLGRCLWVLCDFREMLMWFWFPFCLKPGFSGRLIKLINLAQEKPRRGVC